MARSILVASALLGLAAAQHPGGDRETHPKITTWKCTTSGGCVAQQNAIVIDALAHPVHQVDDPTSDCGSWGSAPDPSYCPDAETCQKNCVMDPVTDYAAAGITTDKGSLSLDMLRDDGSVISPRVYLLAENEEEYEMIKLTGQELAFDVDVSKLPCGMNGALYFSEMEANGGKSALNTGGANYGTGYCDAQCFVTPFINGEPNIDGKGSCCNELDIWEANKVAASLAPHTCSKPGLYRCTGDECTASGVCDKNGCTDNAWAHGHEDYYGPGLKVDTTRPFTVITTFPADDSGKLTEVHRKYIQDGKTIEAPDNNFINDAYCNANGASAFERLGGVGVMGDAMSRGMVLAMSVWWDEGGHMNWLDSGNAGPCNADEGAPDHIRSIQLDTAVTFSNIKWGDIGSTHAMGSNYTMPRGFSAHRRL